MFLPILQCYMLPYANINIDIFPPLLSEQPCLETNRERRTRADIYAARLKPPLYRWLISRERVSNRAASNNPFDKSKRPAPLYTQQDDLSLVPRFLPVGGILLSFPSTSFPSFSSSHRADFSRLSCSSTRTTRVLKMRMLYVEASLLLTENMLIFSSLSLYYIVRIFTRIEREIFQTFSFMLEWLSRKRGTFCFEITR